MQVDLRFGRSNLCVELPDDVSATVLRKPPMPLIADPAAAVREAMLRPKEALPLAELARGARRACIAICDITRPVPNHLFLRPLIECLEQAGISSRQVCVLIATGLHRPNLGTELREVVGDDWVLDRVAVVNHDARNDADHVVVGQTPRRGTVVRLDRRFVEADLRIVTGLVEPHFMAGYSGGRKVIAPGLAHLETITTFHNALFMSDPATAVANLTNNPLHDEQLEIVRMLGDVYAVNTVIDERRRLSFLNFGDVVASHDEAVNFVRRFCELPVSQPFSTVVTSAAGYPLDKTFYQTVKGLVGALGIVAPGGDLLMASECSEGLGSAEFVAAQRQMIQLGPQAFWNSLAQRSRARIDEWQTQMHVKALLAARVSLYAPALSDHDFALTGVARITELATAIRESLQRASSPSLAIIPEGPYVAPFVCR